MAEFKISKCQSCNNDNQHEILQKCIVNSGDEHYRAETKYFMLKCCGCGTISFRSEYHDYEMMRQIDYEEWDHEITVDIFPHFIDGHSKFKNAWDIPELVRSVYDESLLAIQEGAYTLASLGLRGTIEAVCNEQGIKGKNLQARINAMFRNGLISKKDSDRLHAIRFLGNDAAHEIKKADKDAVLVALEIIEHLLKSMYVFEKQANQLLEVPISDFSMLKKILKYKIESIPSGENGTLANWLGKDHRRLIENPQQLEAELIDDINKNQFPEIQLFTKIPGRDGKIYQMYKRI